MPQCNAIPISGITPGKNLSNPILEPLPAQPIPVVPPPSTCVQTTQNTTTHLSKSYTPYISKHTTLLRPLTTVQTRVGTLVNNANSQHLIMQVAKTTKTKRKKTISIVPCLSPPESHCFKTDTLSNYLGHLVSNTFLHFSTMTCPLAPRLHERILAQVQVISPPFCSCP
jgi:hypothetical protein